MKNHLKAKDYRKIFFLYGLVYATIPIIIVEILWDCFVPAIFFLDGLFRELIESFFRAALIEEFFKFYGFMKASKAYHFSNEREFMVGAGMIGLAYAVIEKIATGSVLAILLSIIFPMHILWQMNQGRHFYQYQKARDEGDNKKAKREFFLATFAIFLMHGCWDASISLVKFFSEPSVFEADDIIGGILLILILLWGVFYLVFSIIKIRKVLKANPLPRNQE